MTRACLVTGLVGVSFLTGCTSNTFPGGPSVAGLLFTQVTDPAQNLAVATDAATGALVGESSSIGMLGLIATGDSGLDAAMKAGKITKVHHVDHQTSSFFGFLYVKQTTIVHGE
ncbi:MAG: hypothetical protein EXS13_08155 [Planctomycetes bacterium]|nr:hypothetical protein [Planctomycetota bacterium]